MELQRVIDGVRPPVQFSEIANADHGLQTHEGEVAERVMQFVAESLAE